MSKQLVDLDVWQSVDPKATPSDQMPRAIEKLIAQMKRP